MENRTLAKDVDNNRDQSINLKGYVEKIKRLGGITFLNLRDRSGTAQVVVEDPQLLDDVKRFSIISLDGPVRDAPDSRDFESEVYAKNVQVLSTPAEPYPIPTTPKSREKLEKVLQHRPISLRNPRIRDIFKVQQTISQAFRDYLLGQDFTEIFSPKIVPAVAESGSNQFKLDYFGSPAFLTQSPQFYKQMLVGSGFERVFEVGHVYRAEEHSTSRHLNEYVSMDLEMGFIDSFEDLMNIEEGLVRSIFERVSQAHPEILRDFGVEEVQFGNGIPRISLGEMKRIIAEKYGYNVEGKDMDPEGERLASKYAKEEFGSDLVFLTHYPTTVRLFYTMPTKGDPSVTDSFDLILRGVEITTGGQRIHNYRQLLDSMKQFDVDPMGCEGYVSAFKYGMPPHGGMGIGLERLTARTLDLKNVKEASLFPRDRVRFSPWIYK